MIACYLIVWPTLVYFRGREWKGGAAAAVVAEGTAWGGEGALGDLDIPSNANMVVIVVFAVAGPVAYVAVLLLLVVYPVQPNSAN